MRSSREFPGVERRTMRLSARKVFYEGNSHNTILLTIDDVTRVARDGTGDEGVDATKGIAAGRGSGPAGTTGPLHAPAPRREGCEKKRT